LHLNGIGRALAAWVSFKVFRIFAAAKMAHLRRVKTAPKMGHPIPWGSDVGHPPTRFRGASDVGHPPTRFRGMANAGYLPKAASLLLLSAKF
jgi:hypothetical protein